MAQTVRVRFAPSPTGFLHVGGLRTALYNYLFARRQGGQLVLRIEDTDQARKVEGAVENLIATLHWAGIDYDEGPDKGGPFGPYVQSQRLPVYRRHAEELIEKGHAYCCFCAPERLDEVRKRQMQAKETPSYDRRCRDLPADDVRQKLSSGIPHVVRMKVPLEGEMTFHDLIRGDVTVAHRMIDDQVLIKSDGFPTYHMAVVTDDHLMQITHVIRGEEWLPSLPKHILLYRYFGWELPVFAHLPLLLNPDRSKLSKRQGDVAVEDYRARGYLREAVVNFIAFLGWNPGDDRELFTLEELIREFALERVGKSGAVFNVDKLDWLNFQHLKRKSDHEVLAMVRKQLSESGIAESGFADAYLLKVIGAMRERAGFVRDFVEKCPYFYAPPKEYDPEVVRKRWKPETPRQLEVLSKEFSALKDPVKEEYEAALLKTAAFLQIRNSDLIHPLRLAVSGTGTGPGLYDILDILGKDETLRRIHRAIQNLA